MSRDKRYPPNWSSISKRQIARAQNRCEECGIEEGKILRRRRVHGRGHETVSEEEYVTLRNEERDKREAFRAKQQEQIMEDERRYLTPERQNDLVFRMQLAEAVRDLPGWTVMVDPEERYGFYPKATTILIAILTMTSTPIPTIHVHFENSRR